MNKRGFTLIELIVVIAIIAILASIVAPSAFRAVEKAKVAKFTGDYKSIKSAVYALYADVGAFPGHYEDLTSPLITGGARSAGGQWKDVQGWDGPYLEKIPRSPWLVTGAVTYSWQDTAADAGKACWGSRAYFFCIQPPFPASAMQAVDQSIDGGDGPGAGSIRGRVCTTTWATTGCLWSLFARE